MNEKEARKIVEKFKLKNYEDRSDYHAAESYLEAIEKAKKLVEALEKIKLHESQLTNESMPLTAIKIWSEEALAYWKKEV